MTDAPSDPSSPRRWAAVLFVTGAALAIVGLLGALVARRSADLASALSSDRLLTPGGASTTTANIAMVVAPATPPDYSLVWLALVLTVVGLLAVGVGTINALRSRQTG